MSGRIDPRLYLVIGPDDCGNNPEDGAGRDPVEIAVAAVAGGVSAVQLRAKDLSGRVFLQLALRMKQALAGSGVPLLINDRVDIALAAQVDGVHLGQDDLPAREARRLLGPEAIIGLTVRSRSEAEQAPLEVLDYLSIGGVFATRSKDNPDPPIGLAGLTTLATLLRARSTLPLCAI
ncbi:MAG: thiamine phosphate synthase, partial [Gammaproteobacteria bacterium]